MVFLWWRDILCKSIRRLVHKMLVQYLARNCVILPLTFEVQISKPHQQLLSFLSSLASDGDLVTSVIPICSNDSAAVEVVARSYDDIRRGNSRHASLLIRIDYICVGNDGQQVRVNRQFYDVLC